ncbi:MAG: hypothetical protein Q4C52_04740 [Eubacteriales bacterium]|nr:hypothetical protein [Eubacteriales bacterium]
MKIIQADQFRTSRNRIITKRSVYNHNDRRRIDKAKLAFLKDQLLQDLTCSGVDADILARLEEYQISLDDYYIAAFQLMDGSSRINQLKDMIICQKTNSYCFRYNNLILSIYYYSDLEPVIENCNEIIHIPGYLYSMKISAAISQLHHGAEEFPTAAFEAIHTLSLNFYSTSSIAIFDSQNIQAEYILSV